MPTEDTQPKDAPDHPGDEAVPPLKQRLQGVLLAPVETFRRLGPDWGLAGPIVLVALAGLLAGALYLGLVDVTTLAKEQAAYSTELLPEQTRRMMAQGAGGENTLAGRGGAFMMKVGLFAGPTLGTVLSVVAMGLLLFVTALLLGRKKAPALADATERAPGPPTPDLLKAMVVAAHAKLVALVGTGAFAIGTILGNPQPQTSPMNAVDMFLHPALAALLGGLNPIAIWHTVLLSIGLTVSLGVARSRAIAFGIGLHVLPWLLCMGSAFAQSALMGSMGGR